MKKQITFGCLLVALVMVAYAASYRNDYVWDDDNYVTDNMTLRDGAGLVRIWTTPKATPQYYPMVHTLYWLEYRIWGGRPAGYHVINAILHAGVAVLLWLVCAKLGIPGAWIIAAVFAVHPVHVESVAWVTERKNVLSGLFYMAALLAYLKSMAWLKESRSTPVIGWYVAALALFLAALLSKTVTCSLPAVIVLLIWWKRKEWQEAEWKACAWLVPFFLLGVVLAVVTVRLEHQHVGARGMEWGYTVVERCLIAGRSLWFYMGKLVLPHPLIFFYRRWAIDQAVWWQYLFPLAFGAGLVALWWFRAKIGKGPLVAMLIFAGTLLPALGFINVYPHRYSFVADHFQYLASIAFIALVVAGLVTRWQRRDVAKKRWVGMVVVGVFLAAFGTLTLIRSMAFKNEKTLWVDTIRRNPTSWAAFNNLGLILMGEGNLIEAEKCFRSTVQLKPDHAQAHAHLGMVYERMGRVKEAEQMLRRAVEMDGDLLQLRLLLADFYARTGRFAVALNQYGVILGRDPDFTSAHIGAGHVYMERQEYDKATMFYSNVIERAPKSAHAYEYRARAQAASGQVAEAKADAEKALSLAGSAEEKARISKLMVDLAQMLQEK